MHLDQLAPGMSIDEPSNETYILKVDLEFSGSYPLSILAEVYSAGLDYQSTKSSCPGLVQVGYFYMIPHDQVMFQLQLFTPSSYSCLNFSFLAGAHMYSVP